MHQNTNTGRWSGLPSVREVWQLLRWPLAILVIEAIVLVAIEAPLWTHVTFAAAIAMGFAVIISRDLWIPALVARLPTKRQLRLWLRDHWKRCLVIVPLGLAGFLAWHFWPWGLVGSVVILFLTVTKVISWQRVRKGYGGMEFPGETVLRAEHYHWLAFFVFGWEWGKQPKWEAPERPKEGDKELASVARGLDWGIRHTGWLAQIGGLLLWRAYRDRRLWPIGYLLATAAALLLGAHENLLGPEPEWWVYPILGLVWLVGLVASAIYWWDFRAFVWPGYYAVITDQNINMVRPTRGLAGIVEPDAATIPLGRVGHWVTHHRAFGGGDWDPAFVFGEERVVFRFLKDPEDFSRAAREQAERLQAQARAQRR